jgi:hypothetical protein
MKEVKVFTDDGLYVTNEYLDYLIKMIKDSIDY